MKDWQERVTEEASELAIKIAKLDDFIEAGPYEECVVAEQGRLTQQLYHMRKYREVLGLRILNF